MDWTLFYQEMQRDEGVKLRMYRDTVGKWTIGIGHNLSDRPISPRAVKVIFEDDTQETYEELRKAVSFYDTLDPVRQRALLNMAFNLGVPGLLKFKRFLTALSQKDYALAADHLEDSLWWRQVGERAKRLQFMIRHGRVS